MEHGTEANPNWFGIALSGGGIRSATINLGISKVFNRLESVLVSVGLLVCAWVLIAEYKGVGNITVDSMVPHAINAVLLLFLGFFTNPNALSFHRFYRKQLADLFLRFSGKQENMPLGKVFNAKSDDRKDYISPHPLINTRLNLINPLKDEAFQGTKTSDYFLLSPFFCGSKLVGYVPTDRYADDQSMTPPAAVTISAAAEKPTVEALLNWFDKGINCFETVLPTPAESAPPTTRDAGA